MQTPRLKNHQSALIAVVLFEGLSTCYGLVRLATWNLLAPQYAKISKYPWCDPHYLDWNYRQSLIIPQLLQLDADIICLQEVQVDVWPDLFAPLESIYEGVIQNVTSGHNVASAILVRKDCPWKMERVESRSRALLTVLRNEHAANPTKQLYLGTVHLEAGMNDDNDLQRYHQLKSLFKRLAYHCRTDGTSLKEAAIVLAGDFNMLRSNLMHQCLSEGRLYHPEQLNTKPPIETTRLQDAFQVGPQQAVQMTYAKGSVLDYIWTSTGIDVGEALPFSLHATQNIPQPWPSREHPSDHIPIGVELAW